MRNLKNKNPIPENFERYRIVRKEQMCEIETVVAA